jgi:RNA polymerase sigma-54 factor
MRLSNAQLLLQQQKLSPQQIQMIKLLELPTVMLEQRIKEEIEENVVLEEEHSAESEEEPQQISVEEYLREDDTPSYKSRLNHYSKDDQPRNIQISGGRSLQESLVEQLGYRNLSDIERQLAIFLVGSIDGDGYLRRDLESLSDDIAFSLGIETSTDELEYLLSIIHRLEPVGVGARDLRESLLLQMEAQPLDTPEKELAHRILEEHFEEFVKKHYERLISRLAVSEEEFRAAVQEI